MSFVNRKLLPLKLCFFLLFTYFAPIAGFMPTIARQLGYSLTTYGVLMTITTGLSMMSTVFFSAIVDKFRVMKKLFMVSLMVLVVVSFLFIFVPRVPLEAVVELKCHSKTLITAMFTDNDPLSTGNKSIIVIHGSDSEKLITCNLDCEKVITYGEKMKLCDDWMALGLDDTYKHVDVTLKLNDTEIVDNSYVFNLLTVHVNGTDEQLPTTCQCPLKTKCRLDCNDKTVMEATTAKTYRGNVLDLYQFWIFFILLSLIWNFTIVAAVFINPICLDILEDKSVDYGKQKLWGSIGFGVSSLLVGWIVDLYSFGKKEKDYTPIFVWCITFTIFNLFVTTKIKIVETNKSCNSTWQTVRGLFTKRYVIIFIIWSMMRSSLHAIITHFLFWYMEDMVLVNDDSGQLVWLKTLQGIAQGVQCFAGEIPFLFWSGWIIKRLGYANCMALVLGAMAVRMYLYTVIWNPAWIVLIELLNGVSYALGFALTMSYVKTIAPPNTLNTIVGCIAFLDGIGDSLACLLGGYVFDWYGGVRAFRFFAYMSALICCLNMVANHFGWIKDTMSTANMEKTSPPKNDNCLVLAAISQTAMES